MLIKTPSKLEIQKDLYINQIQIPKKLRFEKKKFSQRPSQKDMTKLNSEKILKKKKKKKIE